MFSKPSKDDLISEVGVFTLVLSMVICHIFVEDVIQVKIPSEIKPLFK
jgi:hypothetical protein